MRLASCEDMLKEVSKCLTTLEECLKGSEYVTPDIIKKVSNSREVIDSVIDSLVVKDVGLSKYLLSEVRRLVSACRSGGISTELIRGIEVFWRLCRASKYDFLGLSRRVSGIYRFYMAGMVPFFALSGFYGATYAIAALILLIPFIIAVHSLRRRSASGVFMALFSIPLPVAVAMLAIKYGVTVLSDPKAISAVASSLSASYGVAVAFVAGITCLGVLSIVFLGVATYFLIKYRGAFVSHSLITSLNVLSSW